jgi:diaminohydroxyphosphoribosylaminopyrimidine deaminase/5-amino-6-(5-phosphoribosylamino)uracil reductase
MRKALFSNFFIFYPLIKNIIHKKEQKRITAIEIKSKKIKTLCIMKNFMKHAISLAKKAKGNTSPNPCVGAVIVKNGQIVASGYHQKCGTAHAEVNAINDAKSKNVDFRDATIYVTLEPCNHYGKTPPCTKAIIEAGIKRVVIGTLDPNPEVAGGGAEFLRQNGVSVIVGQEEEACLDLIEDFLVWKNEKRPFITLKMATTLDGKIATRNGSSAWISCEESRAEVHEIRKISDAIIVGENTFFNDNPKLTARAYGVTKQPKAIVITQKLPSAKDDFYLLKQRPSETIFLTNEQNKSSNEAENLRKIGCIVESFENLSSAFKWLFKEHNCHYILCEGGGFLAEELVSEKLVDEFIQYICPKSLGDEKAISLFSGSCPKTIKDGDKWKLKDYGLSGDDIRLKLKLIKE